MTLICDESIGDFLVVRAPFSCGPDNPQSRFIAFTTLAQRSDGGRASYREGVEEQARSELKFALAPLNLSWLSLEHAAKVVLIPHAIAGEREEGVVRLGDRGTVLLSHSPVIPADAAIVNKAGHAVAFTTADCIPVVLASESRKQIAGIHAGWRGIAKEVIENCCDHFASHCGGSLPEDTLAWLGPAIGSDDYEIDSRTRSELLTSSHVIAEHFSPTSPGHFLTDLSAMAKSKLVAAGIPPESMFVQSGSTLSDMRYHSARRDGIASGRMATVLGIL